MQLTIEQKHELKRLQIWKNLYNEKGHQRHLAGGDIEFAEIGDMPKVEYSNAENKQLNAETVEEISYLGKYPLIIGVKNGVTGEIVTEVVNPRFKERHLFNDYVLYKRGLLPKEYIEAWFGPDMLDYDSSPQTTKHPDLTQHPDIKSACYKLRDARASLAVAMCAIQNIAKSEKGLRTIASDCQSLNTEIGNTLEALNNATNKFVLLLDKCTTQEKSLQN